MGDFFSYSCQNWSFSSVSAISAVAAEAISIFFMSILPVEFLLGFSLCGRFKKEKLNSLKQQASDQ